MVNILVAPAAYKGSIPASSLATAMAQAARQYFEQPSRQGYNEPNLVVLEAPIADGGDDTVLCLHEALGGELIYRQVVGPTGQSLSAPYLRIDNMAIVELAAPSGIAHLASDQLAALAAHTFGLGQLIAHATESGATKIVVTLGGSASTDGGTAALTALGAKFLDRHGMPIAMGGGGLCELATIDLSDFAPARSLAEFVIATDVISPLLGPTGAAYIFAPQKGADPLQVEILENNLAHLAAVIGLYANQVSKDAPGAGAAGGAGYGLASLLPAKIVSGFHFFAKLLNLTARVQEADLVIVAEGCLDGQSLAGKGVGEIIALARQYGKDILAIPALCALDQPSIAAMGGSGQFIIEASAALAPKSIATLTEVGQATQLGLARWLESNKVV